MFTSVRLRLRALFLRRQLEQRPGHHRRRHRRSARGGGVRCLGSGPPCGIHRSGSRASERMIPAYGNVWSRTFFACCSRYARSFSRSSGRCAAMMAMASSAAFVAPGFPMARVPTGMPAGI